MAECNSVGRNSIESNSYETHNIYPNLRVTPLNAVPLNAIPLSDQQQFRLNKISEIKDYFVAVVFCSLILLKKEN